IDRAKAPSISVNNFAIRQSDVRCEVRVGTRIERVDLADPEGAGRAAWPFRVDRCAGNLLQPERERGVVGVSVRDQTVADRTLANRPKDSPKMVFAYGAGIDNGQALGADNIGVGAVECERTWIVRRDSSDAWRHQNSLSV